MKAVELDEVLGGAPTQYREVIWFPYISNLPSITGAVVQLGN